MSDEPFRATLFLSNGQAVEYPQHIDAAVDTVRRAVLWKPPALSPAIVPKLDDRDLVFGAISHIYGTLLKRGDAVFHFTDDEGQAWSVPTRSIVAVKLADPTSTTGKADRLIGFRVEDDEVVTGMVKSLPAEG